MAPLGGFKGKRSGTTSLPLVMTADAMEPFRLPAMDRMSVTASVPSYLIDAADQREGVTDVALSATIWTEKMRAAGEPPAPLLKTGSRYMYWTPAQMLAQHSITG